MRELRIWYEYKDLSKIDTYRNIEIPSGSDLRKNLAFYYRLVG